MKRSEMIKIIEDRLYDFIYFSSSKDKQADLLLQTLEKTGMIPPLVGEDFADIRDYYWESENET